MRRSAHAAAHEPPIGPMNTRVWRFTRCSNARGCGGLPGLAGVARIVSVHRRFWGLGPMNAGRRVARVSERTAHENAHGGVL
jgi:hypothetical protein